MLSFLARSLACLALVVPLVATAAVAQSLEISQILQNYDESHAAEGEYGGTLEFPWYFFAPFKSLNVTADVQAAALLLNLYPRLMVNDALLIEPKCHMCTSYQVSANGMDVTFELRTGMRWSDGVPITSRDIVMSARIFGDPTNFTDLRKYLLLGQDFITYSATDKDTVVMHLPERISDVKWKEQARMPVLPAHVFGTAYEEGGIEAVRALYPLGTTEIVSAGAWRFGSYDAEEGLILLENREQNWIKDAYGNSLPYVDRLHFYGTSGKGEAEVVLSGSGDLANQVLDGLLIDDLQEAGHKVVKVRVTQSTMDFLIPNFLHPDPRGRELNQSTDFRRALSMLLDRAAYKKEFYGDMAEPVYNFNNRPGYVDLPYPRFDYDLQLAQKLLEGLGLSRDSTASACPGGCYSYPDGSDLVWELIHFDRPNLNGPAKWVARALREGGLNVSDSPQTVEAMLDLVYLRESETFLDFDLWFDARSAAIDGREFWSEVFHLGGDYRYWGIGPEPGVGPSDVQPWEMRLSEIATIIESEAPKSKKVAAAAEGTVIFAEQLPMIPIVQVDRYQAYDRRVGNTFDQVLPDDYLFSFFMGPLLQVLYIK
ncbi:MAG TPA: ABC transporter substrate-binding protein [Trueperaceae bacterium]